MSTDYELAENTEKVAKVEGEELRENKVASLLKRAQVELIKKAMMTPKKVETVYDEELNDSFVSKIL